MNDALQKAEQQLACLERKLALQKIQKRKADTRRKIELGGLVIKAGMAEYNKAVILGALLDAREQMRESKDQQHVFELKGQLGFIEK